MAPKQDALLTAEDYRSLPEEGPRYELIQGELRMAPAPNSYHQRISCNLIYLLRQHLEGTATGELFHAPLDVYLSDHDVVQPDLVFIQQARLATLSPEGVRGAPTLVIEILSRGTQTMDRHTKKRLYQNAGVEELWLVDPEAKRVKVYRLQQDPDATVLSLERHDRLTSICFPGLQLDCETIFR